jgi:hypothetical protein
LIDNAVSGRKSQVSSGQAGKEIGMACHTACDG